MSLTIDIHPHWWLLILWSAVGIALLRFALLRLGFHASVQLQRGVFLLGLNFYVREIPGTYDEMERNRMLRYYTISLCVWPFIFFVSTPSRYVNVPPIDDPNPPNEHSA